MVKMLLCVVAVSLWLVGCDSSSTVTTSEVYATKRITMGNQINDEPSSCDGGGTRKVDSLNYYFNGNAEIKNGYPWPANVLRGWCTRAQPLDAGMGITPLMIYYSTAAGSEGGYSKFQTDVNAENLPRRYIDLGLLASYFHYGLINDENMKAASILINPDLLGEVFKQNWLSKPLTIDVNGALEAAVCVLSATTFNGFETLDELWGTYFDTNWDGQYDFNNAFTPVFDSCLNHPLTTENIPEFSNDFAGYTLAMNWLVQKYGQSGEAQVTYAWHMNISAAGEGMKWLYNDLTEAQIKTTFSKPITDFLKVTAYSDADLMPSFLAFDKYGADDTQIAEQGGHKYPYLYNARDWDNYLSAVKQTSVGLNDMPMMLWQIPGGHLQYEGDPFTDKLHISSFATYLFGDENLENDLSNAINLSDVVLDSYHNCTDCSAVDYLTQKRYAWSTSNNIDRLIDANVFAIEWMTYTYPTAGILINNSTPKIDDQGWLANKVIDYVEKSQ